MSDFSFAEKQSFLCQGRLASGDLPLVRTDNCNFSIMIAYAHVNVCVCVCVCSMNAQLCAYEIASPCVKKHCWFPNLLIHHKFGRISAKFSPNVILILNFRGLIQHLTDKLLVSINYRIIIIMAITLDEQLPLYTVSHMK